MIDELTKEVEDVERLLDKERSEHRDIIEVRQKARIHLDKEAALRNKIEHLEIECAAMQATVTTLTRQNDELKEKSATPQTARRESKPQESQFPGFGSPLSFTDWNRSSGNNAPTDSRKRRTYYTR